MSSNWEKMNTVLLVVLSWRKDGSSLREQKESSARRPGWEMDGDPESAGPERARAPSTGCAYTLSAGQVPTAVNREGAWDSSLSSPPSLSPSLHWEKLRGEPKRQVWSTNYIPLVLWEKLTSNSKHQSSTVPPSPGAPTPKW